MSFDTTHAYQVLDPQTVPITGNMMIEASAGTGKTYTITLLVLRLLLGLNQGDQASLTSAGSDLFIADENDKALNSARKLPEILIVTFTNAATAELKERIYSKIVELKESFFLYTDILMQKEPIDILPDPALLPLIEAFIAMREERGLTPAEAIGEAIALLTDAEGAIDQASIFTIHAFSHRLLKENALDLGQSFHFELSQDLSALYREAIYHFWREECYPLDLRLSQIVQHLYGVPIDRSTYGSTNLLGLIRPLIEDPSLIENDHFEQTSLKVLLSEKLGLIDDVKARCLTFTETDFRNLIDEVGLKKTSYRSNLVEKYHKEMQTWAKSDAQGGFSSLEKFTLEYMESRLQPEGDLRRMKPAHWDLFEDLAKLDRDRPKLLHYAAYKVVRIIQQLKKSESVLGFSDLLTELNEQTKSLSTQFIESLHLRYRVVLIDEFQDTDHLQLDTFRRLFFDYPEIPFVMIGDPKQSIYGFRGADINAYLSIKGDVDQIYTLNTNYRSGTLQVDAVNQLFGRRAEINAPFIYEQIPFITIGTPEKAKQTMLTGVTLDPAGMTLLDYQAPAFELKIDKKSKKEQLSQGTFQTRIAEVCAKMVVQLLNEGRLVTNEGEKAVAPEDITILVRSNREADYIQRAFRKAGLNSVYLSERNSVFDPEESIAGDLYLFLRSLVFRHERGALLQSLGSVLYGFSVTEYEEIKRNSAQFESLLVERNRLNEIWDRSGVLAMIRSFIVKDNRLGRLLALENGERLASDLFHLGELLQKESFNSKEALLLWLYEKMYGISPNSEAELRLESDFKTIQIMTIHKSKGLEFPIVFLPFGSFKSREQKSGVIVDSATQDPTQKRRYIFEGTAEEEELQYFQQEALAEDLRLLYVALTRAKFHTFIGFSQQLAEKALENSPLAYLMNITGDAQDFYANFNEALTYLSVAYEDLKAPLHYSAVEEQPESQIPAKFTRKLGPLWRFTSFSNLSYQLKWNHFTPMLADEKEIESETDELTLLAEEWGTSDGALTDLSAIAESPIAETPMAESLFPKGAVTGNFIHLLLERFTPEELENPQLLERQVARHFAHLVPEERLPALVVELQYWLQHIFDASLPIESNLRQILSGSRNVKELEFMFPIRTLLTAQKLNAILNRYIPRTEAESLSFEEMRGFLRGFIDLFFEVDGRYYVADYKSNTLAPTKAGYDETAMLHSIKHAHYDLQYLIYTVAMVKFLQNQQPDFDYERDFGGVFYFYLRGMEAGDTTGIYYVKPDYSVIAELLALFGEVEPEEVA